MKKLNFLFFLVLIALPLFSISNAYSQKNDKFIQSRQAIPNRYIVVLEDDNDVIRNFPNNPIGDEKVRRFTRELSLLYGGQVDRQYSRAIKGYAAAMPLQQALALSRDPRVKYVEEDYFIYKDQTQNNAPAGLDRIDQRNLPLNSIYNYSTTGAGVHVYVIDSGIRATHTEFAGRIGNGQDFVNDGQGTNDCDGHGTHVAGIIGGTTYGVAKNVTLHPLRIFPCEGASGGSSSLAAIDWITTNRVPNAPGVVNMSLGGGYSTTGNNAVANSIALTGLTYVVSAGNENNDACDKSPASTPQAITVGSTRASTDQRSSFSNYGVCVDVFAPGSSITSTWFTSDTAAAVLSGTSMSAPNVAGIAARFLQNNPNATPAQVENSIINSATNGVVIDPAVGSPNRLAFADVVFNNNTPTPPTPGPAPSVRIPERGVGDPYPSQYVISGGPTVIGNILVNINGFSHTATGEVSFLLEGPTGARFLLQSGVGLNEDANNISYAIYDGGSVMAENTAIQGSSFKPTAYDLIDFPAPGPGTNYNNPGPLNGGTATLTSTFSGTNANGIWKLYVKDENLGDRGRIDSWSVTAYPPTPPTPPSNLRGTVVSDTQINVSWNTNPSEQNIVSYSLRVNNGTPVSGITSPSYSLTGLEPGTGYNIEVSAVSSTGVQSSWSSIFLSTTGTTPVRTPTNVRFYTSGSNYIYVAWDTANAPLSTYFNVRVNGSVITSKVFCCEFRLLGLNPNTNYSVEIQSVDSLGNTSNWSSALSNSTINANPFPSAPPLLPLSDLTFTASPTVVTPGSVITVNWTSKTSYFPNSVRIGLAFVETPTISQPLNSFSGIFGNSGSFTMNAPQFLGDWHFRYYENTSNGGIFPTAYSNVIRVTNNPNLPPTNPTPAATASFVSTDSTTKGNWIGNYGGQGYSIIGEGANLPNWAQLSNVANNSHLWAASSSDARSLRKAGNPSDRIAAAWYTSAGYTANSFFDIVLNLTDGQQHRVGLYAVDWDNYNRSQIFEIIDWATGIVLDTQTVTDSKEGVYLNWRINGRVIIRVKNASAASVNAVVSGIFIDSSTPVTPTPTPIPTATASFVSTDTLLKGDWIGNFGGQGSVLVGDATSLPGWLQMNTSGQFTHTWAGSTSDVRGLKKASNPSDRIASTWYTPEGFTAGSKFDISLNITDGQSHKVTLYAVDWDNYNRSQVFEVIDTGTGAVLDTRTISNFTGGVYLNWILRGQITIRVKNASAASGNAVVSGLFFDSSTPVTPTPTPIPTATASFVSTDTLLKGDWIGNFGGQGSVLVGDATSLPGWLQMNTSGQFTHTWAGSTSDVRGLKKASNPSDRIASTWYTPEGFTAGSKFDISLNITDGQSHKVTLYAVDWDNYNRSQVFEVIDTGTGAVLDTRTISNFTGGVYLNWILRGQITIRVKNASAASGNAVVSGLFFDSSTPVTPTPTPIPTATASFVSTDTLLKGDWIGNFGGQGSVLVGDATSLPGWLQMNTSGQFTHTWAGSTSDVRGLKKASNPSDRIASTWYTPEGFTAGSKFDISLNITDGQSHKVTLYAVDWDNYNRSQVFEVIDTGTGAVLDTRTISNFTGGVYLNWILRGQITIRVKNASAASGNAVVSGLFVDN